MVDIHRVLEKRTDSFGTLEELRHSSEEEDQRAPVPRVEAERKVTLNKVLASFCVLLLVDLILLSFYHFKNLNHKEQYLEKLRNINDILTSNYSDLLEVHATLQSQYTRNYSALQSLYSTLKEQNDEESKVFRNLKEFYCDVINIPYKNTCPVCKLGWVRFKSKCYFLSIEILTWNESRDWCKKRGGQLVNIECSDVQKFLRNHADVVRGRGSYYWIGRYGLNKEKPSTNMEFGPVKLNRPIDEDKEACLEIDLESITVMIPKCTNRIYWICESDLFLLHI